MGKYTALLVVVVLVTVYLALGLGLKFGLAHNERFNRDICLANTLAALDDKTLSPNSTDFHPDFIRDYSLKPRDVIFTLQGCKNRCGGGVGWYTDIGPRLTTWLIPILLLLSNIELSPLDKRRFLAVFHALGDPIDTTWSLIHKIESYCRCYDLVVERHPRLCSHERKVIATVLAGVEEVYGPNADLLATLDAIVGGRAPVAQVPLWWSEAACGLACGRTDEFFRTCLAILLYIYQIVAAFVAKVGGEPTSPPGGRIGTALLLSWLVPVVLLSNTIGGFTSRGTCYEVLERLALRSDGELNINARRHYESQSWSGAIYSYRPNKRIRGIGTGRICYLLFLAVLPVVLSTTAAFVIIWHTPPNGLNCRHGWVLGIFTLWLASAFTTTVTYELFARDSDTKAKHWHWILIKDSVIALASLTIIFLSSSGLFNTCYCWSGAWRFGTENSFVLMNTAPLFKKNGKGIYPIVVGICLSLQILFFAFVVIKSRRGLGIMRWSETQRTGELDEMQRQRRTPSSPRRPCQRCNHDTRLHFPGWCGHSLWIGWLPNGIESK